MSVNDSDGYTRLPNGLKCFDKIVTKFTTSTSAPTIDFDSSAGYNMGDCHILTGSNGAIVYICTDPTKGAAVWEIFIGEGADTTNLTEHGKVNVVGGVTIGQAAYINDESGAIKSKFGLGDRTGHDPSHLAGLFKESKPNNEDVEVIRKGKLVGTTADPLDTSACSDDPPERLHLSTAGNIVGESPGGGGSHVEIGRCLRSHATEGVIIVDIASYVHNIRAWSGGNIVLASGDDIGGNEVRGDNYTGDRKWGVNSLGAADFDDVTFQDPNSADFTTSDLARHQLELLDQVATKEFNTTAATSTSVRTVTITQPESVKLEFIIGNKRIEQPTQTIMSTVHTGLNGTDVAPENIFTYTQNNGSDQPELTASNTDPNGVLANAGCVCEVVGSVNGSASNIYATNNVRPYINQLLEQLLDRLKEQGNLYISGMAITATATRFTITSGLVRHVITNATIPTLDINAAAAVDTQFTIEDDDTYTVYDDFQIDEYYDGATVLNTHHVRCRIGVVINNPELTSARFHIIPQDGSQVYTTPAQAWADASGMARTLPRNNIVKFAFTPLADIVIKNTGGTFTLIAHPDSGLFYRDIRQ